MFFQVRLGEKANTPGVAGVCSSTKQLYIKYIPAELPALVYETKPSFNLVPDPFSAAGVVAVALTSSPNE